MEWLMCFYAVLLALKLASAQVTPSCNSSLSEKRVEEEAEKMYRVITDARDTINGILDATVGTESISNLQYLQTQKDIYNNAHNELNTVANLAERTEYPQCAAKAQFNKITIISKYREQSQSNNDDFKIALEKIKASCKAAKSSLNDSLSIIVALIRDCNNDINKASNGVVDCYTNILQNLKNRLTVVSTTLKPINLEYESVQEAYVNFQTNNNIILAEAKVDTSTAVTEILTCTDMNKNSLVQLLAQIDRINAITSDYFNTNIDLLKSSINNSKSEFNLALSFVSNNLQAEVQPFILFLKYLELLHNPKEKEVEISSKITAELQNTLTKLNTLVSNKIRDLNILEFVETTYANYKFYLSLVSESKLISSCVPKDTVENISKEKETERCLTNMFLKFSNDAQEARDLVAQKVINFNILKEDIRATIQNIVPAEINNSIQRLNALFITNGYDPENILQIIEQHFSSPLYKIILQNQLDIKSNLEIVRLSTKSILNNLEYDTESALSSLFETTQIIKLLNPDYNITDLITTTSKIKTELIYNITEFVNEKYNTIYTALPSLVYNYTLQFDLLLRNGTKCFPVDLLKIINCLEPLTTAYNKSLTKAIGLSVNALTDTNNIVERFPCELKQLVEVMLNKIKTDADKMSIKELNNASLGTGTVQDYRNKNIIQFQNKIENRIKKPAQGPINSGHQFLTTNKELIYKFKQNLENLYLPLRGVLESSSVQPKQFSPCQILPKIEQAINVSVQNVRILIDGSFTGSLTQSLKDIKIQASGILIDYVTELSNSNCSGVMYEDLLYNECIGDINAKYEAILNTVENNLNDKAKTSSSLLHSGIEFNKILQARELKVVENKIKKEFAALDLQSRQRIANSKFLQESLQNATKEYKQQVLYAKNVKTSFDPSIINTPFIQFQIVLNTSADSIKLNLNTIEGITNVTPSLEFQSVMQSSVANLTALLQPSSSCYQQSLKILQAAFENANNNIEQFRNQIIIKNIIPQSKINKYVNFINEEEIKYTENAVKEHCKTVSISMFQNCVKSYFDSLINDFQYQKQQIEDVVNTFSNVIINTDLNNFKQNIKAELLQVNEVVKNEFDKVKANLDRQKSKDLIVKNGVVSLNNIVTLDFLPVINNVRTMLGEERQEISKAGNNSLKAYNTSAFFNELINIGPSFLLSFEKMVNISLTSFKRTVKAMCFQQTSPFDICVESIVNSYKSNINNLLSFATFIGEKYKSISKCAKTEIETIINS